jgi:FkbM family methyltransferase
MKPLWLIEAILQLVCPLLYWGAWGKKTMICVVTGLGNFELRVNTYDKFALLEVFETGEYSDADFVINPGDIIVDIGAHIGAFSVYAAKRASGGRVYSYEPNEENYRILTKNITLNGLKNVSLFNKAVAGKTGTSQLFIRKTNSMHSIYGSPTSEKIEVPTLTLNDIMSENMLHKVDFLKIDAEGAEYDILLNTPYEILTRIDKIVLEYHDYLGHNHKRSELENHLERSGFNVSIQKRPASRSARIGSPFERIIVIGLLSLRKIIKQGTIKAKLGP